MDEWQNAMGRYLIVEKRGQPSRFLGMTLLWKKEEVLVYDADHIRETAAELGVKKKSSTPYIDTFPTALEVPYDTKAFQAIVGKLLYISRMWRPDVRYACATTLSRPPGQVPMT